MNFRPLILSGLASITLGQADVVTLSEGNRFAGRILSLSESTIEILSPHSDTPLKIKPERLANLEFSNIPPGENLPTHAERVLLLNGDSFPADLRSISKTEIRVNTWFLGELTIPRTKIQSIHFGLRPQQLVYEGPKDLDSWATDHQWRTDSTASEVLISTGRGAISRDLKLPKNFILRFRLSWQNTPDLRVYFGHRRFEIPNIRDAYRFSFGSQGAQLERIVRTTGDQGGPPHHAQDLGGARVKPEHFSTRQVEVEFRVNRQDRLIYLYLDGELHDKMRDQKIPPAFSGVTFESRSAGAGTHSISALKVFEWDTITQRLYRETPSDDPTVDTVSVGDGDRFTGSVSELKTARGELILQTEAAAKPLAIPSEHLAVVHFAKTSRQDITIPNASYQLELTSAGMLSLSHISLGKTLQATHPLLGDLTLDRRILRSINRRSSP